MPAKVFLDTNVLVYAFNSHDPRTSIAEDLMIRGAAVGIQTLNEFVNVMRSKGRTPWTTLVDWLRIIDTLCPSPVPVTRDVHLRGLQIAEACGYHIYDSVMLAAAIEASCTIFYSDNMQDGHVIDNLEIRNPFSRKNIH